MEEEFSFSPFLNRPRGEKLERDDCIFNNLLYPGILFSNLCFILDDCESELKVRMDDFKLSFLPYLWNILFTCREKEATSSFRLIN